MRRLFASTLGLALLASGVPAGAIQFANGESAFNHIPRLVGYSLTDSTLDARATYNVRVEVPANSDIGLGRVIIGLANPGNPGSLLPVPSPVDVMAVEKGGAQMMPVKVTVSSGSGVRFERAITPAAAQLDGAQLTVTFDKPIAPGSTVNVEWTTRSPRDSGTYLFDVVAFPAGDAPRGQFLGFARVNVGTHL